MIDYRLLMKSTKILPSLLPVLILSLVSLLHLYPILGSISTELPFAGNGDVNLESAILLSNVHHILNGEWSQIYHLPMFFPASYSMTLCFPLYGQSVLALPYFLSGFQNLCVLYNLFILFCYIMSGWGAYLLIREMTRTRSPALIAACLYMLLPFRVANIPHLNLLFNFPIPFCFLYLYRFLRSNRCRDLLMFNAFLLMQFLFDLSLGFYLTTTLVFFFLWGLFVFRPPLKATLFRLLPSLLGIAAVVLLAHYPFLSRGTSLSPFGNSFTPGQHFLSQNFYSGQSYLVNLFRGQWGNRPYFPGFTVALFFLLAFVPHLRFKAEYGLFATASITLLSPALMLLLVKRSFFSPLVEAFFDVPLVLFVVSLTGLLLLVRRRIQPELMIATAAYVSVIFISFSPFDRIFNLFGLLARFLPFLARARGAVRTMYVFPLLALIIASFGLKHFLEKNRRPLCWTAVVIVLLAAESLRWPVHMERLSDPGIDGKKMYRLIRDYPQQSGVLELPFLAGVLNIYPLYSRFHRQHTYHGHNFFYTNRLQLENRPELAVRNGYPGLGEPGFVRFLVERRLRIILILGAYVESRSDWQKVNRTVIGGESLGLYERVVKTPKAILLILRDRLEGRTVSVELPRFFFSGKHTLSFSLFTGRNVPVTVGLNGFLQHPPGIRARETRWRIPIGPIRLHRQQNILSVESPSPVILQDIRLEE